MEPEVSRALLVVAKRPAPGQTKTRLSPPLLSDEASTLYECFLRDTLDLARRVPQVRRVIGYTPLEESEYFERLAPDFDLMPQIGDSLGERLDGVLARCLADGFDQVVVMGSDCPTLPATHLAMAFDLLAESDVVLGPSEDGGYYLIGTKQPQPALLREVEMSTPWVLRDTLALAEEKGLRVGLLPGWYDVDTFDDLLRLQADLDGAPAGTADRTRDFFVHLVHLGTLRSSA